VVLSPLSALGISLFALVFHEDPFSQSEAPVGILETAGFQDFRKPSLNDTYHTCSLCRVWPTLAEYTLVSSPEEIHKEDL
jgi:hypothetical protein